MKYIGKMAETESLLSTCCIEERKRDNADRTTRKGDQFLTKESITHTEENNNDTGITKQPADDKEKTKEYTNQGRTTLIKDNGPEPHLKNFLTMMARQNANHIIYSSSILQIGIEEANNILDRLIECLKDKTLKF